MNFNESLDEEYGYWRNKWWEALKQLDAKTLEGQELLRVMRDRSYAKGMMDGIRYAQSRYSYYQRT